jgi:hypothetical protein
MRLWLRVVCVLIFIELPYFLLYFTKSREIQREVLLKSISDAQLNQDVLVELKSEVVDPQQDDFRDEQPKQKIEIDLHS